MSLWAQGLWRLLIIHAAPVRGSVRVLSKTGSGAAVSSSATFSHTFLPSPAVSTGHDALKGGDGHLARQPGAGSSVTGGLSRRAEDCPTGSFFFQVDSHYWPQGVRDEI